jgi:L-ribulokinase
MPRYALGLDYGTESARALLVDVADGREAGTAVAAYPDGVIDRRLPGSGVALGPDWALQNPCDYLTVLETVVPAALREAGATAAEVAGIGVDFTSCTVLPARADGTPLCALPEFAAEPHAWVKLWKHHAAQPEADRINAIAAERREPFLARYGGKTSSEWLLAKAWQILDEAPAVYAAAERLIEAGDWLVWQLTGEERRSACQAGYKGMWSAEEGYPSREFLRALDPRLENLVGEKLSEAIHPIGVRAGGLTPAMAARLGLRPGTPVGVAIIDAHAAVPAATIAEPGQMLLILGTSACHLMLGVEGAVFPGIAGVVKDGILPGFYGYEAGQPATGDILAWYVRSAVPAAVEREAAARGMGVHELLEERAAALRAGESGLLALDWWNGNRSVLMDADLSGMIVGLTLDTQPEEIYRALIEASAFGTREILENFERHGHRVRELIGCGGVAEKNATLMQIYADVTGRPIRVTRSGLASALGAAMLGAVAAGAGGGGYDSLTDAAARMGGLKERVYLPRVEEQPAYHELFAAWKQFHDWYGRGGSDGMKRLRRLRDARREAWSST